MEENRDSLSRHYLIFTRVDRYTAGRLNEVCDIINNNGLAPQPLVYEYEEEGRTYTIYDPIAIEQANTNKTIMSPGFKILVIITEIAVHTPEILASTMSAYLPIDGNYPSDTGGSYEKNKKKSKNKKNKSKSKKNKSKKK